MGGRSGLKKGNQIKPNSIGGDWIAMVDEETGAIKYIRKKIKYKKKKK